MAGAGELPVGGMRGGHGAGDARTAAAPTFEAAFCYVAKVLEERPLTSSTFIINDLPGHQHRPLRRPNDLTCHAAKERRP